jgi:hypothetical protein
LISSTALTLLLLPLIFERWGALTTWRDMWAQIRQTPRSAA